MALAVIPLLVAWYFGTHRIMGLSGLHVGIVGIVVLFTLFFLGMPIGFALMATGLLFVCVLRGPLAGINMFGNSWFNTVSNYTWAPLMSFMLMGYACYYSRFGEDLYRLGTAWIGHMRGGLAIGTVAACTLFGAVVGDTLSGTIAMSAIALPEMRKARYDDKLALGTLSCSGTIGSLIPPSTTFILYGVLAEQSIGDLFMAGILPGLLCMVCFMGIIWLMVLKNTRSGSPPRKSASSRTRLLPQGAVCHRAAVHSRHRRHLRRPVHRHRRRRHRRGGHPHSRPRHGQTEVVQLPQVHGGIQPLHRMCFTLLGGATFLGYFMTMSRMPTMLANSIASLDVAPIVVMCVIVIVMCVLGCFLPAIPLILITVPIFLPIAKSFHWDLSGSA